MNAFLEDSNRVQTSAYHHHQQLPILTSAINSSNLHPSPSRTSLVSLAASGLLTHEALCEQVINIARTYLIFIDVSMIVREDPSINMGRGAYDTTGVPKPQPPPPKPR